MTFGYFVAAAFITFLSYALIPLLIALFRKKEIARGKYRGICYAWNIIALIFDFLANVASGDARIKIFPYLIWTEVAVWIGNAILKSRNILADDASKIEKTATNQEKDTTKNEKKFVCRKCGTYHSGWYQTCPHCGAIGKMEESHLPPNNTNIASGKQDGWKCAKCGKTHYSYEFSCSCGASRSDEIKNEPVAITHNQPSAPAKENRAISFDSVKTTKKERLAEIHRASCPSCGAQIPEGAKYCAKCGRAVASFPVAKYCRFCGSRLTEGSMYCHNCGKEVQMYFDASQAREADSNSEKGFLEHQQQMSNDFSMPSYSTDSVLYRDNKEYIDSLISEGRLNMKIALYVASDVVLIESGIKDIDLAHDLEVVLRELILEYGLVGAVTRYSFVLGLFLQLGALSQEEVTKHKDRLLFLVRQELEQSRDNRSQASSIQ